MSGIDGFVVLLLHGDGTDGSTTITDSAPSPHTVTAGGNAQIDTAQSKFGGASILFDGTGDVATSADSADWDFGSGNFTIDLWFRLNATGINQSLVTQWTGAGSDRAWTFDVTSGNVLGFTARSSGAQIVNLIGVTTLSTGAWHHAAIERNGNVWTLFLDGAVEATATASGTIQNSTTALRVGARGSGATEYNGWTDEVRVSKGVARYGGSAFTPPAAAYDTFAPAAGATAGTGTATGTGASTFAGPGNAAGAGAATGTGAATAEGAGSSAGAGAAAASGATILGTAGASDGTASAAGAGAATGAAAGEAAGTGEAAGAGGMIATMAGAGTAAGAANVSGVAGLPIFGRIPASRASVNLVRRTTTGVALRRTTTRIDLRRRP